MYGYARSDGLVTYKEGSKKLSSLSNGISAFVSIGLKQNGDSYRYFTSQAFILGLLP